MLVAEHERVPHSPAGWQIAVVVLRYFVAVLMVGSLQNLMCAAQTGAVLIGLASTSQTLNLQAH